MWYVREKVFVHLCATVIKIKTLTMNFSKITLPVFGISLLVFSGCSKDDDGPLGLGGACGFTWSVRIADEITALSQAASEYSQDSSQAKCLDYKKAYNDYLDEAEDIKSCVPAADKDDFQDSIDEARAELNKLPC